MAAGSGACDVVIDLIGGNCPVQAEGTVNGIPFYFRARGARWSMGIGGDVICRPDWHWEEPYGEFPDAGWMEESEALGFLYAAAARFAAGEKSMPLEFSAGSIPEAGNTGVTAELEQGNADADPTARAEAGAQEAAAIMRITASCGCAVPDVQSLAEVFYKGEDCDAVAGIRPCVFSATYCIKCAEKLKLDPDWLESGAAGERWLDEIHRKAD